MTQAVVRPKSRTSAVVHWGALGFNRQGEVTVDYPEEINVRVEKGLKRTLDPLGNTVTSDITIFTNKKLVVGSLIWIGELESLPMVESDLLQVASNQEVPSTRVQRYFWQQRLISYSNKAINFNDPNAVYFGGLGDSTHGGGLEYIVHGGRPDYVTHS